MTCREQNTRPIRHRRWLAKRLRLPVAALRPGGWCIYLRSDDTRPLRVVALVGGVAKVERDGRTWEEPAACVRGCRVETGGPDGV